jgi:four helix bundle protein
MKITSYKELIVWQKSMLLAKQIYATTNMFPKSELLGLIGQMRRAAVSIPSNIAEGFSRGHAKEHAQFLRISLGSLTELETQLILSKELGFIKEEKFVGISSLIEEVSKMLHKVIWRFSNSNY